MAARTTAAALVVLALVVGLVAWRVGAPEPQSASLAGADGPAVFQAEPTAPRRLALPADPSGSGAELAPAPPEPERCVLRALDESGAPIEGARAWLQRAGAEELAGATQADGTLALEPALVREARVVVAADGFAPERRWIGAAVPARVDVALVRAVSLAGRVVLADGMPAGAGLRVVAWRPRVDEPGERTFARALAGDTSRPVARTDAHGAFRLDGLDPTQPVAFSAGGRGLASSAGWIVADPLGPPVEIVVERLVAVLVRPLEPDGSDPRSRELVSVVGGVRLPDDARPIYAGGLAVLAGVERREHDRLFAYFADGPVARLGPIETTLFFPKYEPVSVSAWAEPVDPDVVVHELVLDPADVSLGTLAIELAGLPAAAARALPSGGALAEWLTLEPRGGGAALTYALRGRRAVEDVPHGSYAARLEMHGVETFPPPPAAAYAVDVGPRAARVVFDLSSAAVLELRPSRADGTPYADELEVELAWSKLGAIGPASAGYNSAGRFSFDHAPYWIVGLRARTYTVLLRRPRVVDDVRWNVAGDAVLEPGRVTTLALKVPVQ